MSDDGTRDSLASQTTQILLPKVPQYARLPSPEFNSGDQAVQILLPKMPQYPRLPPPEVKPSDYRIHRHKEQDKISSSTASNWQATGRHIQKDIPIKNQRRSKERKRNNISRPILTTQAAQILLPKTPQYPRLPPLESKKDVKAAAASGEMSAIRALCEKYHKNDIYNMDEILLSWRHPFYTALAPESTKNCSQMTLALCVNSTGSDRFPVWTITSEKKPISLDGSDPRAFGAVWQSSEIISMTSEAMQEWLLYFYSYIGARRSVILLLDNVQAHKKGVELTPPPPNIRIQWLPPGTTSRYQPLDQGINRTLKNHYRQIWLKHMIQKLYDGESMNPIHTVSPELAVRWVIQIWKNQITHETINDCFRKSSVIPSRFSSFASEDHRNLKHFVPTSTESRRAVEPNVNGFVDFCE